jgi:hypothetical protein
METTPINMYFPFHVFHMVVCVYFCLVPRHGSISYLISASKRKMHIKVIGKAHYPKQNIHSTMQKKAKISNLKICLDLEL